LIPLGLEEVRELCPGRLSGVAGASEITGVSIDTRTLDPGELFVAIGRGAEHLDEAVERGAAATLVPDDAEAALAALAGVVRSRSDARVVAITGSTGKTSTKDILAALLRPQARLVAAEASFNNELGIPLTLCRLEASTELAIVEIGMRGLGQIADACRLVRPHVGLVTGVGPVHLELLGTIERVAQAKAEVLGGLEPGGIGIVPADEPLLEPFIPSGLELRRFGPGGDYSLVSFEPTGGTAEAVFDLAGERLSLRLELSARHQAVNTLAALVAYQALGFPLERAQEGAAGIRLSRWRGEETTLAGEGLLINDVYNANPTSLRAALEHQAQVAAGRRRVAVLGTMAELGTDSSRFHRELGALASSLGVAAIVAVGEEARAYLDQAGEVPVREWAPDAAAAIPVARRIVRPGDCVLVKGSRVVGLEAVSEALASALPQC
jgi:UDP-N-acetylmuramoyl-tripeptide--D-alanyl-D-alanine ligase